MSTTSVKPIKILIIDDHPTVRAGLHMLLESQPGLQVVGEAGNQSDAHNIAVNEQPDIILLDLDMGEESGLDYLPKLLKACKQTRVLILTGVPDPDIHRKAVRLGAIGLVTKDKAPEILFRAIEKVHTGEAWLDRQTMASMLMEMSQTNGVREPNPDETKIGTLTNREREVIAVVCEGYRNKEIADKLCISDTTVRHHLTSVFSKLGVSDRFDLIIYAYRHGLAEPPK